jgi:hypothetical protein
LQLLQLPFGGVIWPDLEPAVQMLNHGLQCTVLRLGRAAQFQTHCALVLDHFLEDFNET